jgi:hypothetical protein
MTQLTIAATDPLTAARAEALFTSSLRTGAAVTAAQARAAIAVAVRRYGSRGCATVVAGAYGDYPDTAAARMRWARGVVDTHFGGASRRA